MVGTSDQVPRRMLFSELNHMAKHRANDAISGAESSPGQSKCQGKHPCAKEGVVKHTSLNLFCSQVPTLLGNYKRELCFLAHPLARSSLAWPARSSLIIWPALCSWGQGTERRPRSGALDKQESQTPDRVPPESVKHLHVQTSLHLP